jgi:peptidoglycan hydrolase-like protein with peptidoglycan-binding domain
LANSPVEAKKFQLQCNFWGWQDAMNRNLIVDGDYSAKSAQACMDMQRQFKITADGNYGPQSQAALQKFLDAMAALAPK